MLGISNIIALLFLAHSRPQPLLLLIPPHIVHLRANEQHNRQDINAEQSLVTSVIQGLVVRAVDIRRDYRAGLHAHVVKRC